MTLSWLCRDDKTDMSATLVKSKQFSIPIAILGFLFCIVGLALYAIIYACQKEQFPGGRRQRRSSEAAPSTAA